MKPKILFIIGSLRKQSFNRQLAEKAAALIGDRAEVSFLDYADIPYMNQDIEYPAPEAIARVRKQVAEADGVWICSAEYNYNIPGPLKNLLDWLSRPYTQGDMGGASAARGQRVTFSAVGGGENAGGDMRNKLEELLDRIGMNILPGAKTAVALPAECWQTNVLVLPPQNEAQLTTQVEAFLTFISAGNNACACSCSCAAK